MLSKYLSMFYARGYKLHLVLPIIFLIVSLILIPYIPKGIDLQGGTFLRIQSDTSYDADVIKAYLISYFGINDVDVKIINRDAIGNYIEIQYPLSNEQKALKSQIDNLKENYELNKTTGKISVINYLGDKGFDKLELQELDGLALLKNLDVYYNDYKNDQTKKVLSLLNAKYNINVDVVEIREVGATMGAAFYNSAWKVSLVALILITISVFIFFREFVPSIAVIASGLLDVLGGLAGMALFNIPLSLTTIPALLMLVGYSVDTDIMLTTKVLHRKDGTPRTRAGESIITGLTMTMTTLVALLSMAIISWYVNISVIYNIAVILLCGLFVDIISTWFMNAPILLWYVESKKRG